MAVQRTNRTKKKVANRSKLKRTAAKRNRSLGVKRRRTAKKAK